MTVNIDRIEREFNYLSKSIESLHATVKAFVDPKHIVSEDFAKKHIKLLVKAIKNDVDSIVELTLNPPSLNGCNKTPKKSKKTTPKRK